MLPLMFKDGATTHSLGLPGSETIDILGLENLTPRMDLRMMIHRGGGKTDEVTVMCRVDTPDEVEYYRNGGIQHYVLREMALAA